MPSLFVSRSLALDSPLRLWANKRGYDLQADSLIRFSLLPFVPPALPPEWIFFYSSKAVKFWFAGAEEPYQPKPKFAALGPGTAQTLQALGQPVDFCGQGNPATVATDFNNIAAGQRVLFPRALHSRRTIEKALGERIQSIDLVVYTNESAPRTDLQPADIVVLTSPLNVTAYFNSATINREAAFLAIGATTAAALAQHNIQARFPDQPSEAGLLHLLTSIAPPT